MPKTKGIALVLFSTVVAPMWLGGCVNKSPSG